MQVVESIELLDEEYDTCDLQVLDYNTYVLADSGCVSHNCGQNGSGKSMLALSLAKLINPKFNWNRNILYAYHRTSDFIDRIESCKHDVLVVDEMTRYLHYREFQKSANSKLMQYIEISRANEVSYVACARAYKKLDLNYRQGKVAVCVWMIDWKKESDELGKSVAAVFAAPPIVESQSRFDIDCLSDAHNFNELRYLAESRSSFCGYLFLKDVHNYITKEELKSYEDQKQQGITASMEQFREIILNKEAKDEGRKTEKQEEREKNITEAKIQKEKEYNEWLRVKKGKRIKEGGVSESKESTEEIEL